MCMMLTLAWKLKLDVTIKSLQPNQCYDREDLVSNTWFTVEDNSEKKAFPDKVHVKLLGYKWNSEQDILYPGFAKLNLNKKV